MSRPFVLALLSGLFASSGLTGQEKTYTSEFMPLAVGSRWVYRNTRTTEDKKTPERSTLVVECERQESVRVKKFNAKKEELPAVDVTAFRLVAKQEARVLPEIVGVMDDGIYRFSALGKDIDPPLQIFKLPVKDGESWTVEATTNKIKVKGTFTAKEETIDVPAGRFATMRVSSRDFFAGSEKMEIDTWFAPKVGIVKRRLQSERSGLIEQELERFESAKGK
ncbi:MAG: hypothetical protein U0793_14980 [Gemmataceae bacterium]